MSTDTINVGVVGLGFMGTIHIGAYDAAAKAGYPCRLAAVADGVPERLTGKRTHAGLGDPDEKSPLFDPAAVRTYERAEDLFADPDIHLVSICTPTDSHVDLAIAALRAGKHVLVEKPLAVRSADVQRLADAARDAGRFCLPAMCMRFWPAWRWLKERIDDGRFGRVRSATFHRLGGAPAWTDFYMNLERSGGALIDLHIHDADFVYHCFGAPASVSTAGSLTHVHTHYRYEGEGGPDLVAVEGGWGHDPAFGFNMRYLVNFEKATADFDNSREKQLLLHADGKSEPVDLGDDAGLTGYDVQARHILDLITGKAAAPLATLDEAVEVAHLLEVERASVESGVPHALASE